MTTQHDITIQNVTGSDSGVCVVTLKNSIDEQTKLSIVTKPSYVSIVPVMGSNKTLKLIWHAETIAEQYNVKLKIER
ncbi:hypothetical protein MA9V1_160 [Chryseobacterium phage MA9V-1]|nr:hypothetical protein MA9V1_160 [Chryseobacterium phage MA9V-1]